MINENAEIPVTRRAPMTRWKAAGIHLIVSACVAMVVVFVMLTLWYPNPYFDIMGGKTLILILVGVDVVIGPLITLIIFNPLKKTLKFDLSCIASLQLAALLFGVNTMIEARPVFTVFVKDRFDVVTSSDIDKSELAKAINPEFKALSLTGPRVVAALMPSEPEERQRILFSAAEGLDIQNFPQHYVSYESKALEAAAKARPLRDLRKNNPDKRDVIDKFLVEQSVGDDQVGFLPLKGRDKDLAAIVHKSSGTLIGFIDANPW